VIVKCHWVKLSNTSSSVRRNDLVLVSCRHLVLQGLNVSLILIGLPVIVLLVLRVILYILVLLVVVNIDRYSL